MRAGGAGDGTARRIFNMSEIVITEQDQDRIFEAHRDDVIVFRLEENLTTGYGWEVEAMDVSVVELIESIHSETPGKMIGRGGMRVMRFVARTPGIQVVHLRLRRPWEPSDRFLKQLQVTIQVR
jgi:predicted secreted protein